MSDSQTKTNVKARHGENSSLIDENLSVNSQNLSLNDRNSSVNGSVMNMSAKSEKLAKYRCRLSHKKKDVTGAITHFFIKQAVATDDSSGYHSLTTNCSAAKPSRHSLAIFMPKTCLTNYQRFIKGINQNTSALQARHKYSTGIGANIYDGLSGPNTIPLVGNKLRRLNTVVNNLSPSFFAGDNKLTNCSGGYHA